MSLRTHKLMRYEARSPFPGIRFNRNKNLAVDGTGAPGSWTAAIRCAGKQHYLFSSTDPRLAAYAYQYAAEILCIDLGEYRLDLGLTEQEKEMVEPKVRYRIGKHFAAYGVPR